MKLKDWNPFFTACIGIFASLITAVAVLYGQVITQKHEDIRHLRTLAYQAAVDEWKVKVETIREAGCYDQLPHFNDILLEHIEYSYVVQKYGADDESNKYAGLVLDAMLEGYLQRQEALTIKLQNKGHADQPKQCAK